MRRAEPEHEGRPDTRCALRGKIATHEARQSAADRETETGPARRFSFHGPGAPRASRFQGRSCGATDCCVKGQEYYRHALWRHIDLHVDPTIVARQLMRKPRDN